jgi:TolB-like protein
MINNKEKQSISIVNFQNFEGENEPLGEFFAEEISTYIINEYAKFNIVDRSKLNTLIKEQGLKENGLLDKKTVGKIGKFIGIDAMITGKYEILDSVRVKVWIKVIDIENAQILGTEESIFTRGSLIDKFIKKNEKMKKK